MSNQISNFKFWCQKVMPMVYDDSLSYYELLNKVVAKLNECINSNNTIANGFEQLKAFIDNYFNTLDIQDEINAKLDAMATDGTLDEIINQHIFGGIRNQLNDLENTKAEKSDLELQTERINQIISGASADPNAELVDIRTEYDGTTAATAGDAVRAQITAALVNSGSFSDFYNNTANISIDTNNATITVGENVGFMTQRGFVFVPKGDYIYTKQTAYEASYFCVYDLKNNTVRAFEGLTGMTVNDVILFGFYSGQIMLCKFVTGNFTINGNVVDTFPLHKFATPIFYNGSCQIFTAENAVQVNMFYPIISDGINYFLNADPSGVMAYKDGINWNYNVWICVDFGSNRLAIVNGSMLPVNYCPLGIVDRNGVLHGASQETLNRFTFGAGNGVYNHVFGANGVYFGDSVTAGVGTDETNPWQYAYPVTTSGMLGASNTNMGFGGSRLTNTGDAGTIEHSFLNRMTSIPDNMDYLVIMGGLNDYFNNVPLGQPNSTSEVEVYGAINKILEYCINRFPTKCILVVSPFVGYDGAANGQGYSVEDLTGVWENRCRHYNVPFLDFYKYGGMGYTLESRQNAYYPASDRTHPNIAGQKHIGYVIANFIKRHFYKN